MKYVKEHIDEKFTDKSDPIHDMGIGIICERDFNSRDEFFDFLGRNLIYILKINELPKIFIVTNKTYSGGIMRTKYYNKICKYINSYITINGKKYDNHTLFSIPELAKRLKTGVLLTTANRMHDAGKLLTEKFISDSDPIHDLNIGFTIDFDKIADETIRKEEDYYGYSYGRDEWIRYLQSLVGKTITGYFKNHKELCIFKIEKFESYKLGTIIMLYSITRNERYKVINTEKYNVR